MTVVCTVCSVVECVKVKPGHEGVGAHVGKG
jgi:hypothetical protein